MTGKPEALRNLLALLSQKVVGQPAAMKSIVPCIQMYMADLSPAGRPVGVFLLLGPTGTGKTKTVEAIADVLHGSEKKVLKVDCGGYQMEHEVAKLIGSPPGYLGHRETQPVLTQARLDAVTSEYCGLSLVLFDEIEKAAPSLTQLLLGIMDKATLQLGDGNTVNFENALLFFTSNLGAREMMKETSESFGFRAGVSRERGDVTTRLENIALNAVKKKFSPEFVNRIDAVITYLPLEEESLSQILDQHITELQSHVNTRLGARCFSIEVTPESRVFLLRKGTSAEYGARELKRTIHRHLTQPLAALVAGGQVDAGARVNVELAADGERLSLRVVSGEEVPIPVHPSVLIVDDNRDLLNFLKSAMIHAQWDVETAESLHAARDLFESKKFNAVVLDYMLPDGTGVDLALEFHARDHTLRQVVMCGVPLPPGEQEMCKEFKFSVLQKPFLATTLLNLLRSHLSSPTRAVQRAAK